MRRDASVVGAAALALAAGAAFAAQPPAAPKDAAPDVCLSNACSAPASILAKPATVNDAISVGDARQVRALGGSPTQVVEALMQDVRLTAPTQRNAEFRIGELARFADIGSGAVLAFDEKNVGTRMRVVQTGERTAPAEWGVKRTNSDGTVQNIVLMSDGKLFVGASHPPDPPD